jgi:hypothetical protein
MVRIFLKHCASSSPNQSPPAPTQKVWRNIKLVLPAVVRRGRTAVRCALRILESQDSFKNEVSLLEIVIADPKFHCELNDIEYYWAALRNG